MTTDASVREKLRNSVPAERLKQQIGEIETEAAALRGQAREAEDQATEAAADPGAYQTAADRARQVKTELSVLCERLERLQRAYSEAREREKAAFVDKATRGVEDANTERDRVFETARGEMEAEEKRRKAVLARLDSKKNDALVAVRAAERVLRYAEGGVAEATVRRIDDLEAKVAEVHKSCPTSDGEMREAADLATQARNRLCEGERHAGADTKAYRRECEAAEARANQLATAIRERNEACEQLRQQIRDLELSATV